MKKAALSISLLTSLVLSTSAFADEFTGLRLGVGYSDTSIKVNSDAGNESGDSKGLKVEAGFDFNRVVGLNASYEMVNNTLDNFVNDSDVEGHSIKIGTDLGYAFYSKNVFFKPYAAVGFVSYSVDDTDFDGESAFAGVGLRYHYKNLYADLGVDCYFIDGDDVDGVDNYRFIQGAATIGYKF